MVKTSKYPSLTCNEVTYSTNMIQARFGDTSNIETHSMLQAIEKSITFYLHM